MSMSKQNFVQIASILRDRNLCSEGERSLRNAIALDMADYFASENPRFDREKFLTACWFG